MQSLVTPGERLGRSLWWMWPARIIGWLRPGLARAAEADALALGRRSELLVAVVLPLAAILLVAVPSVIHALSQGYDNVIAVDFLRIRVDDMYTESFVLTAGAMVLGIFSPALGAFLVVVFVPIDLIAASFQRDELYPLGPALIGRGIADWVLWLLVVEIPVFARTFAESEPEAGPGDRLRSIALGGLVTAAAVFVWTLAAPTLMRPASDWTLVGRPLTAAVLPLQNAGWVLALIGGLVSAGVVAWRGPDNLLGRDRPPARLWARRELAAVRHIAIAGLFTLALGGVISSWADAALLFAALVAARPVAVIVMERSGLARLTSRLPTVVRLFIATGAAFGVAWIVASRVYTPSDVLFTSVVAGFIPALFAFELIAAERRATASVAAGGPSVSPVVAGTLAGLLLLGGTLLLPVVALADNCSDAGDCYGIGAGAAAAAGGAAAMMGGGRKNKSRDDKFRKKKLDYIDRQIQKERDNPSFPDRPDLQKSRDDYWQSQREYWSSPDADSPASDDQPTSSAAFPSSGAATKG